MGIYDEALAKSLETGDSRDLGRMISFDLGKALCQVRKENYRREVEKKADELDVSLKKK